MDANDTRVLTMNPHCGIGQRTLDTVSPSSSKTDRAGQLASSSNACSANASIQLCTNCHLPHSRQQSCGYPMYEQNKSYPALPTRRRRIQTVQSAPDKESLNDDYSCNVSMESTNKRLLQEYYRCKKDLSAIKKLAVIRRNQQKSLNLRYKEIRKIIMNIELLMSSSSPPPKARLLSATGPTRLIASADSCNSLLGRRATEGRQDVPHTVTARNGRQAATCERWTIQRVPRTAVARAAPLRRGASEPLIAERQSGGAVERKILYGPFSLAVFPCPAGSKTTPTQRVPNYYTPLADNRRTETLQMHHSQRLSACDKRSLRGQPAIYPNLPQLDKQTMLPGRRFLYIVRPQFAGVDSRDC